MWCLYCLGTNPEAQEKLRSEVQQIVGDSEIVTPEHVGRMPYLRNVVRETQR
jgi:cytochrome P450